jgi:hypothetical protein
MDKYYDCKEGLLFDVSSLKITMNANYQNTGNMFSSRRTVYQDPGGTLTMDVSLFNVGYLRSLLNMVYRDDGYQSLKKDYVRDIIIVRSNEQIIQLKNCFITSYSMDDDLSVNLEAEFRFDHVEYLDGDSDKYYEIIREIRSNKLNDLLE